VARKKFFPEMRARPFVALLQGFLEDQKKRKKRMKTDRHDTHVLENNDPIAPETESFAVSAPRESTRTALARA
jgi:hypothetical protein